MTILWGVSDLLVYASTFLSYAFILVYVVSSPWHRSAAGWHTMFTMSALSIALTVMSLIHLNILGPITDPLQTIIAIAGYALVFALLCWELSILLHVQVEMHYRGQYRRHCEDT